ncbi:MAG: hypothetical protein ACI4P4_02265 [Faecousia sp.]
MHKDFSAGLSPLLDAEGKPIVTKKYIADK